jgi:hypothetical protein
MDVLLIFIFFIILIIIITYIGIEFKNYIKNYIEDNIQFNSIQTGCLYKRWGCCPDKLTTKLDPQESNCRGF